MPHAKTVEDVLDSLQNFGWSDYAIFIMMLATCAAIGVYFSLQTAKGSAALDYLVGGQNLRMFPVSLSIIASVISGIALLGTSTEVYMYGANYVCILPGLLLIGLTMHFFILPVFHSLKLISIYEYLERRFDKRLRLFGSVMYLTSQVSFDVLSFRFYGDFFLQVLKIPIMIYISAIAFDQSEYWVNFRSTVLVYMKDLREFFQFFLKLFVLVENVSEVSKHF